MWKKFWEFVVDPETWPGFLAGLFLLAMIPGKIGVMFGSLAVYLVFLLVACCVGMVFGPFWFGIAFFGGVILGVIVVIGEIIKALTGLFL